MRDLRAISLDARSMPPANPEHVNLKSSSPSQNNLFFGGAPSNLLQSSSSSSPKINRPPLLLPPRSDACTSNAAPPRYRQMSSREIFCSRHPLIIIFFHSQSFGSASTWFVHETGWTYRHQRTREQHVHRQASLARQLRLEMQRPSNPPNRGPQSDSVRWGRLPGGLRASRAQAWDWSTKTRNEHLPLRHESLL